jgi:hypothetical protein
MEAVDLGGVRVSLGRISVPRVCATHVNNIAARTDRIRYCNAVALEGEDEHGLAMCTALGD